VLNTSETQSLDHAAQNAQSWLDALAQQLACGDLRTAYLALRAVLHLLRDRLPLPEAVALGAQLPLLIRGIYYEGWRPHAPTPHARHVEEYLGLVERGLDGASVKLHPQHVVDAVFDQLKARLSAADLERVVPAMPPGMRLLFTTIAARSVHRARSAAHASFSPRG
jgi:uncharacterized protein (DUF2267 family)